MPNWKPDWKNENPFPIDNPYYNLTNLLLSRPSAPLFPPAIWNADIAGDLQILTRQYPISDNLIGILHLLNDEVDTVHEFILPNDADPTRCYIWVITNRRERDRANARYWLYRMGKHPLLPDLLSAAKEFLTGETAEIIAGWETWDGEDLILMSEEGSGWGKEDPVPVTLCWFEMCELLRWIARNDA